MATTKTQAFNNKIKALKEYHARLVSGVGGVPSSSDIQATLKFFCSTLKSILKDTSNIQPESYGARGKDKLRISLFPSFHYEDLYYLVIGLCEYVGKLNNQSSVCEAILKTFHILIPFLEYDNLDIMPFIVTSCINLFPASQHSAIIELLCTAVIPFVYSWNEDSESYALESIPTILHIVFQHIEKPEYHSWVVESFMSKKQYFWKDLMLLIAYGSTESRIPATCLLFYYWPELCPIQFLASQERFPAKYHHETWKAVLCERTDCPNKAAKSDAKKMSFEPNIAATYGNKVPPLYLCLDCFDSLTRNKITNFDNVVLPIKSVKSSCESKTCRSKNNAAHITCYNSECTSLNGNKPIRLCEDCHIQKHLGAQCKRHIFQLVLPNVWDCSMEIQPTVVEAIISLCTETNPRWRQQFGTGDDSSSNPDTGGGGYAKINMDNINSPSTLGVIKSFANFQDNDIPLTGKYSEEDQKVISVYGVFLIGEKCTSKQSVNTEILGRIVSGLYHWFLNTIARPFDFSAAKLMMSSQDGLGDFIEKVKRDYILKWIKQVVENNLEVVLMVLLPYPVEYAKIGTCWDSLCDRKSQVKDGLQMIDSLIPYDIITFETWDYIIPFWLETLRTEIAASDYVELQKIMKKIFDQHEGPFPFLPTKLYNFATQRFSSTLVAVQDQVLNWLDILTATTVIIPMKELLTMFSIGVKSMKNPGIISRAETASSVVEITRPSLSHQEESFSLSESDVLCGGSVTNQNQNATDIGQTDDVYEFETAAPVQQQRNANYPMSCTGSESNLEQYSMLSCLCMMMTITNLQLRKNDPHGHGNMSLETPTLTLGLMCDMLQLDWTGDGGGSWCRHTCAVAGSGGAATDPSGTSQPTGGSRRVSTAMAAVISAPGESNVINSSAGGTASNSAGVAGGGSSGGGGVGVDSTLLDTTGIALSSSDTACVHCQNALLWHTQCSQILKYIVPLNSAGLPSSAMTLESLTVRDKAGKTEDKPTGDNADKSEGSKGEKQGAQGDSKTKLKESENKTGKVDAHEADDVNKAGTKNAEVQEEATRQTEYDISELSVDLKLLYLLVRDLEIYNNDPEIINAILSSLTFLIRHAEILKIDPNAKMSKSDFIDYLLEHKLVSILWNLHCSEFSYLGELTVPLLLFCLSVPKGCDKFWSILEYEFTNEDWRIRFNSVEKVTILSRNIDNSMIVENYAIITSLAHAFCNLIGSLDDVNSAVVTRTNFYLDTIRDKSLNCIVKCLELQFDSVIADRTLILLRIYQLSWALPGRSIFSWEFFINRFGIFSIEAQLGINLDMDISNVTDLNNQKCITEQFRQQFERARIAKSQTAAIRSIRSSASAKPMYRRTYSTPIHQSAAPNVSQLHSAVQPLSNKSFHRFHVNQESKQTGDEPNEKSYHRQSTLPPFNLGRRKSKPLLPGLGGLNVAEYTDSNNRFLCNIQEALDLESSSRDTLHQWVTLLLKFMANVDMQISKDELKEKKALSKVQRHLALLLGYSDQAFNIPPYKLRNSTVFHAFISNIAQVMDRNFAMGNSILHQTLVVLQYCPSPQRYASDSQLPTFSLWSLEPQTRIHWLNTLLIVLYKYEYNASGAGSGVSGGFRNIVDYLIRIAINTVENHLHVCKPTTDEYSPPTPHLPRPRDASNVSVEVDVVPPPDTDSPPSPTTGRDGGYGESLNIGRVARSNTMHYAKKDKEMDILTSRFTSPVIKKKVARQFRGRATVCSGLMPGSSGGLIPGTSHSATGMSSSNYDNNNSSNFVLEEDDERSSLTGAAGTTSPGGRGADSSDNNDQNVSGGAKEIILAPITVSSDERVIKPQHMSRNLQPVLEESMEAKVDDNKQTSTVNVENKMVEQLDQFTQETSTVRLLQPNPEDSDRGPMSAKESASVEEKEKSEGDSDSIEDKPNYRQRKSRKSGLTSVEVQKVLDGKDDPGRRRPRRSEMSANDTGTATNAGNTSYSFFHRQAEGFMIERCNKCHMILEHYDEETLGLAIVCFGAYVHREPALAAPCLYDMLVVTAKIASYNMYSWKIYLPSIIVPGNLISIARQFLRCTFYNLFPNGLFVQLFQTEIENRESFFKCMVSVLLDFEDHLDLFQPIHQLLEGFNKRKAINPECTMTVIENMAAYLEALPTSSDDSKFSHMLTGWWTNIATPFDNFFHKLQLLLVPDTDVGPVIRMMIVMVRANLMNSCKPLIDTFATILRFIVENCNFTLPPVLELCSMTNRLFREKGKSLLTKCLIEELNAAIKFKIYIPDKNLLMLIQFVLMDAGGTVEPNKICEGITELFNPATYHILNTGAAELMRVHLHDCITFLSDVHTVHKVKQNQKLAGTQSLHEDTLGCHLKSALAQYVALELSSSTSSSRASEIKDSPILIYMPWLKSIPPATQQGPREFILCVERVRTLNWLLLGSMIHTCVTDKNTDITCQPIPLGFNKSIADLVKVILSGFPDQQKISKESKSKVIDPVQSVIVMSSLYHAFVLCQMWTMYCETAASLQPLGSQNHADAVQTAMEFWMTILPTILHLLTISDDFVVVNGHLLTIMEELIECRSLTVAKVINWWTPILMGRNKQLPGNLQKRLQKCIECDPPEPCTLAASNEMFIKWLKKHVFVIGRNEDQHSAATHIFVQ